MNVTIIETTMHTKYKRLVEAELLEEHPNPKVLKSNSFKSPNQVHLEATLKIISLLSKSCSNQQK